MHRHCLDIYDAELFLATTKAELAAVRKAVPFKVDKPRATGCAWFKAVESDAGYVPTFVFWIDGRLSGPDLVELCAHEASHGAGQLLDHAGHSVAAVDEPHAYLVAWLTRWLWAGAS